MKFIILALTLISFSAMAGEKSEVMKKRDAEKASLAAVGPSVDLTSKDNLVKFIPCETDNDCLRALQESEDSSVAAVADEKGTMVAEFVESPKKGINIYRKLEK